MKVFVVIDGVLVERERNLKGPYYNKTTHIGRENKKKNKTHEEIAKLT